MTLADRLVVMNAGRVEQIGAPLEVYRLPATRFVATFIGSPPMNLMPGKVVGAGVVETGGGRIGFAPDAFAPRPARRSRSASARRICASDRAARANSFRQGLRRGAWRHPPHPR